jgi:hypothetical protein
MLIAKQNKKKNTRKAAIFVEEEILGGTPDQ